jgi:hypothetical protein
MIFKKFFHRLRTALQLFSKTRLYRWAVVPILHIGFAAGFFWLLRLIPDEHSWIRSFLMMIWGSIVLVDLLRLFMGPGTRLSKIGVKLIKGAFFVCTAGFIVWLLSSVIRVINPIAKLFNLDWHLSPLFPGIHNFIFSAPALIAAGILLFCVWAWQEEEREKIYGPRFYDGMYD